MITVSGVTKTFSGFKALDDLSLTVPRGSIFGLVGPNGAGKSTLLRLLTGVYRQDAGEIRIDGEAVFDNPGVKARIASIPDEIFYFTQAGIQDMMRFYRGVCPRFSPERYAALRRCFSLDEKLPMRRLSKGMQKQAAFWLALSMCPDLLVLDEPVDGLDPVARRRVWRELMRDVSERGTTVVVSSHNLRELEDVCDHVGFLNRGKLVLQRSVSELQENLVKIQLALPEGTALPEDLHPLHESRSGRLWTLILRGNVEAVTGRLEQCRPLFLDVVPLTLEEIFIYELGGGEDGVSYADL